MNLSNKNRRQIIELIIVAGITLWAVLNYKLFIDFVRFGIKLVMPVIVGVAIAFILNAPMKLFERKIFKVHKRKHKKLIRIMSLLISVILIVGIIGLIFFLIIPEFITAIASISKNIPVIITNINNLIDKVTKSIPEAKSYIRDIDVKNVVEQTVGTTGDIVNFIIAFLSSTFSKLVTVFFGFIISIYILIDKENLTYKSKKVLRAFLKDDKAQSVERIVKLTNTTFNSFLTGQCLDACLTGFEFFIILYIFRLPYALILGVLFAITALIPYIGAFITLVIGAVLVSVVNPMNALWYVIIFFIVQQFDDNFTYPKIVGKSVGLPAILALVAVLIGGSISGFVGMVVSIPIASVMYSLFGDLVNRKLQKKNKM